MPAFYLLLLLAIFGAIGQETETCLNGSDEPWMEPDERFISNDIHRITNRTRDGNLVLFSDYPLIYIMYRKNKADYAPVVFVHQSGCSVWPFYTSEPHSYLICLNPANATCEVLYSFRDFYIQTTEVYLDDGEEEE
jgi:hypothetical protein